MKPQSAKAKGRLLQQKVKKAIIEALELDPSDVRSTSMGAPGEDIQLSSFARLRFPYSVECKSYSRIGVYNWYYQAIDNCGGHTPLLIIKQNNAEPLAVLSWEAFLKLQRQATADIIRIPNDVPSQS